MIPWLAPSVPVKEAAATTTDIAAAAKSLSAQLGAVWRGLCAGTKRRDCLRYLRVRILQSSCKSCFIFYCESFYCSENSPASLNNFSHIPGFCLRPSPLYVLLSQWHGRRYFSFKIYPRWKKRPSASRYHLLKSANNPMKFYGILGPLPLKIMEVEEMCAFEHLSSHTSAVRRERIV